MLVCLGGWPKGRVDLDKGKKKKNGDGLESYLQED
jgi:hypothetical protein